MYILLLSFVCLLRLRREAVPSFVICVERFDACICLFVICLFVYFVILSLKRMATPSFVIFVKRFHVYFLFVLFFELE